MVVGLPRKSPEPPRAVIGRLRPPLTDAMCFSLACAQVIRLDYDYPPAPGDIDSAESFDYDVIYRVVPGLTFDVCQKGHTPHSPAQNSL
eukprot:991919-Prymnesium_polylepis.1